MVVDELGEFVGRDGYARRIAPAGEELLDPFGNARHVLGIEGGEGVATLPGSRFLDRPDHRDPCAVALGRALGRQEHLDDSPGVLDRGVSGAERQDIGVVVFSAVPRQRLVVARGRENARYLVGGHCGADARAVDHDPELGLSRGDQGGHRVREVGVIDRVFRVGAAVLHQVAEGGEVGDKLLLELEAAVVSAHGYLESACHVRMLQQLSAPDQTSRESEC
jgi:hypothetical protein